MTVRGVVFLAMALVWGAVVHARDIYLLIGQSNMAGRGTVTEANRLPSERVWKFTKDGRWAEGVEPIHFDRPNTGAGPGLAFARALADADKSVEIGLIPCAEGGSPLSRWQPDGDLYSNAVVRARAALATGGRLRGILWHQGEADSWTKENASTYAARLTNMVTHLRAELNASYVPFIAGEVGAHYGVSIEKRGGKSFVALVNRQIKEAISHLPAAGWVSAEGLEPGPDGIHFTTESAYELGRRYAREIRRWQSVPDQTLEGVDYGGAAADWKPTQVPYGFNLQGMRMAGPHVGYDPRWFKWMKEWGFNFVRLPLDYRCWVKDRSSVNREIIDEKGLEPLDAGLAAARENGITAMINLHRIPGEYSVKVRDPEPGNIYTDPDCLRAAVMHWTLLAKRYRPIPREALYFNLINEPDSRSGTMEQYAYVCRVLTAAIRKVDPTRFVVADGLGFGSYPVPGLYDVPGVGQATRGYYPSAFTHFGMDAQVSPDKDRTPDLAPTWPPARDFPDGRLGGPRWKDWHDPFTVENAPAGDYKLALGMVSGPVKIVVATNGAPCATFALEPKADGDWQNLSRYRGVGTLRGEYRRTLDFALPMAVKMLSIGVREGDWAMPRLILVRGADGRQTRLEFGGNWKTMKNVRWNRRFAGWDAAVPLPANEGPGAPGRYRDEGMDAIAGGFIEEWREPLAKGVWCMVGEFGCANHVAHADALRFIESDLKVFRRLGLGWACWGFIGSRFGILNSQRADVAYEDWQGAKLDRKMLELLRGYVDGGVPKTSARLGRVRISPVDPRYFELDGKPFIPIGINLCYCKEPEPEKTYLAWLDKLAANGGNHVRLWCGNAFWDVMPRFGEIDGTVVARLKWMADECAKRGIRIKLTLEQFRGFGDEQPPVFRKPIYAPYAKTMTEWFTNATCQAAFRKKIDAMADALADHPAVAAVEIWNEIMTDWGRIQTAWQTETLAYLRAKFPRQFVLANLGSFSEADSGVSYDRICAREDNDFLQVHRYYDPGAAMEVCYGPIDVLCAEAIRELRDRRSDRPALLAEVGAVKPNHTGLSELYAKDPEGVLMHDMVFAPFFAGSAGCGQMWHWDRRYVDGNDLWWHLGRFAKAIEGLDPREEHFRPFRCGSKAYRLYGLKGTRTTIAWIRDKRVDALAEVKDGQAAEVRTGWKVPLRTGGPVDCYLPWEDRHVAAETDQGRICLPPFRRSVVLRFKTPKVW